MREFAFQKLAARNKGCDIVLAADLGSQPDKTVTWDDTADDKRFAIRDSKLAVWRPHAQDTFFTDLNALKPKPTGPVLCDLPPHARAALVSPRS